MPYPNASKRVLLKTKLQKAERADLQGPSQLYVEINLRLQLEVRFHWRAGGGQEDTKNISSREKVEGLGS